MSKGYIITGIDKDNDIKICNECGSEKRSVDETGLCFECMMAVCESECWMDDFD